MAVRSCCPLSGRPSITATVAHTDDHFTRRPEHWPAPVYDHPLPQRLHDLGAGLAPLPASEARRHHYVPRLVLRGFESTKRPKHVHQLDKVTGKPILAPISTAAAKKRLYAGATEAG